MPNRFYIGEVAFKGEILKGEQLPILDRALFDAVQAKLTEQHNGYTAKRIQSEALLIGRIFDDRGNRMSPSHARKGGVKYRYYVSSALLNGTPERAGSMHRVPANEIENLIVKAVREDRKLEPSLDGRTIVAAHVRDVHVKPDELLVNLTDAQDRTGNSDGETRTTNDVLHIPWRKMPSKRRREILLPDGVQPEQARPIRSENRATLVASIARGRRWLEELVTDATATTESIAKREGCSGRKVNMTISLAFLAPDLVKAAIEGRLPHRMGVTRLADLPAEWSQQHQMLGLST